MPWKEELPNGKYKAWWRNAAGRRRSKSPFLTAAAALRYAGEQEGKSLRGEVTAPGRSIKWGVWCAEWLELRHVESSTETDDAGRIKLHIAPRWNNAPIARIEPEHVQLWVNDLTRSGMPAGTVRRVFYVFSASMHAAVAGRRIAVNPCASITLPTPSGATERYFTRVEIDAVLAELVEPYRTAATLLVGSGLRFNELAGLHWNHVALDRRLITVSEAYDHRNGVIKPYPKSKKPRHVGPLPSWVLSALESRRDTFGVGDGCGLIHEGASRRQCRSGLVITTRTGGPLNVMNMLRRHWKPAQIRAGITDVGTVHDLRHTYASWLVQAGVPLQEVQRLLGHASIVTTQRYAHFGNTADAAIARALELQGGKLLTLAPSLPLVPPGEDAAGAL